MHDKELQEILDKIKEYAPNTDTTLVEKAYYLAKSAHEGVLRKSGEPYIIHPIAVANILADVIIPLSKIIARHIKPGGLFISSGIIDTAADKVRSAITDAGFKIIETTTQGEWYCFTALRL